MQSKGSLIRDAAHVTIPTSSPKTRYKDNPSDARLQDNHLNKMIDLLATPCGTPRNYHLGCRCVECKKAEQEYRKLHPNKKRKK